VFNAGRILTIDYYLAVYAYGTDNDLHNQNTDQTDFVPNISIYCQVSSLKKRDVYGDG